YNALPSIDPRPPKEKQALQYERCDADDSRDWDLGTGRLEDIAHHEPDFYSYTREGSYRNERRTFLLQQAELPEELSLHYRSGNGFQLAEFAGPASPPGQVVAFTGQHNGKPGVAVMIAPETCPHVIVKDRCVA